ncbi:putative B3 domain-containing protein Os03g0621600 [Chenopodium quinoa]|uniref:putative B3 domain-containing protein Os03g0621600 n=1 Tax=Chenopodium quinoa TaxID=63459 RepID=UPI000B76E38A|nr:putative B3 domain-containing protein Os03g0621600 [Chenopodium quinoa]
MESDGSHKHLNKASSATKQYESGDKPKQSRNGASFIKVLGREFSKQLQIPEEFTANMNGYIPHRFIIESGSTRNCWRVEVEKDGDGRMYFRDGWADFVEAHSLGVGNFLLFEYEEQSIFKARIYDRNGCERSVLVDSKGGGGQQQPQKTIDVEGEESEALEYEPVLVKCHRKKPTRLAPRKYGRGIYKKNRAVPRAYRRTAKLSVSENNLCFSIIIHYSKKHQFHQLTIPKAISLKMKLPSKDDLKFQDVQGKCWTVTLGHRRDGRAILCHGWREFMNENKIEHGDKLKFEFMSDELVKVHVTKASEVDEHQSDEVTGSLDVDCKHDNKPSTQTPNDKEIETRMTTKKNICESGSSFSITWKESGVRTYLYMPKAIARVQKLMKKESIVLRDPEGKCWPLQIKNLSGGRVVLAKGWAEFYKGYGIRTGDMLEFKFVSEYLIHLSINRTYRSPTPIEPDDKDVVICLETLDNEEALAIEPGAVITQGEFDAATEPEAIITKDEFVAEFDAATTRPEVNGVIN